MKKTTKGASSPSKGKKYQSGRQTGSHVSFKRFKSKPANKTAAKTNAPRNKKTGDKVRVAIIGGVEEVGRNCTMIEYGNDIIIIDLGLQFPNEDMPGVDYVIPNMTYIKKKAKNVRGVIITHGHYDHIGGIPHIMPEIGNPPLYAGNMAAGIVEKRQKDFRKSPKLNIIRVDEKSKVKMGKAFTVEFFRVNHTIPDSFGIVINTPHGTLIHTGDFKIDHTPILDDPADLGRMAEIGNKGVLALMADSTNAGLPGHQISERDVALELDNIVERTDGRIIIGTFASLLSRIQIVLDLAAKYNKRVLVEGRSMKDNVDIAHELGYLKYKRGIFVEYKDLKNIPDESLIIIGTGAQAQENAFLMRYANDEHKYISAQPGDTVIFSSSVIPGNERTIQELQDTLYRKGVNVLNYKHMDVHAGGHCKQEDLKLVHRLFRPKYLIPIEGHHFMLQKHAEVARSIGYTDNDIMIPDNGRVIEFSSQGGTLTNELIPSDYVFVDGLEVGDTSHVVLRDRKMLAEDGMVVIIATLDAKTGDLIGSPDIISRGFVYLKEKKKLIEQTRSNIKKILKDPDPISPPDDNYLKNKLRHEIGQFLYTKTKKRPMILPVILNV